MKKGVNLDKLFDNLNSLKSKIKNSSGDEFDKALCQLCDFNDGVRDYTHEDVERGRIKFDEEILSFLKLCFRSLRDDYYTTINRDITTYLESKKEQLEGLKEYTDMFLPQKKLRITSEFELNFFANLFENYEVVDRIENEDGWFPDIILKFQSENNIYLSQMSDNEIISGLSVYQLNGRWHEVEGIYVPDSEERDELNLL
ncbi:hypothetical protein KY321_01810, partial [Candidatus Woesearchaeota archaeon]|nr:hypothetical protein [Candidatus Woesearchaeota archaeon]